VPRLALIGPSNPFRGGIARTTTALAAAVGARGALGAFLTPRRQYPRWLYPGGADIDPRACPTLETADRCFGVLEPWTWPTLRQRLTAAAPDAVVVPYWTWAWAPVVRAVTSWGRPVISVVHNPADHDAGWLERRAARAVLGRCRGFLCHAKSVAATLGASYPGIRSAVHPLPADRLELPARAAARRRLGVPDDATAFLAFGLLRPYKGTDLLLEAFARLPEGHRAVLLLAGEPWGGLAADLRRRLADPRLGARVIAALRWVPEEEAPTWFAAADVAVLPYRSATGSAVAAQALGAGLPVIASRVGGLAEAVDDGDSGVLVPPGNVAALVGALERMLQPSERARLAQGAGQAAAGSSWDSYAATLEDLVEEVTSATLPGATRST
jgi:glycosyltransferase involved in cell wall biosynthesis